jgi:hypothetical protein
MARELLLKEPTWLGRIQPRVADFSQAKRLENPSAARLTLLYIWRLRSPVPERGSAPSGFLMPGDVKFEACVAPPVLALPPPFDSQIPV